MIGVVVLVITVTVLVNTVNETVIGEGVPGRGKNGAEKGRFGDSPLAGRGLRRRDVVGRTCHQRAWHHKKPDEHRRKNVHRAMPARMNFISPAPGRSFAAIFRRVADAVKPFGFQFLQLHLPLALFDGPPDRGRDRADLFDQLVEGQANVF
jgi:hypothetical protein